MARPSPKLEWCVIRFGDDMNWWVEEISDDIHWDVDGLSILDPRQTSHIVELCDPLRDYGFDPDIINDAFFSFKIDKETEKGKIRIIRSPENILDTEDHLFALPDVMDEEKGPYADFLAQITRARVNLLNDQIKFEQKLTVDELEEEIREMHNMDYFEGHAVHFFKEVCSILDYVPEGYETDDDLDSSSRASSDEDLEDIPDFEAVEDEKIEEDETMKWEDEEDDEEEFDDEPTSPPEIPE